MLIMVQFAVSRITLWVVSLAPACPRKGIEASVTLGESQYGNALAIRDATRSLSIRKPAL